MKDRMRRFPVWLTLGWCVAGVLSGVLWSVVVARPAYAEKQKAARTFSLDLGYVPALSNNRAMWNLWLEYEYLGSAIFDLGGNSALLGQTAPTRALWAAIGYLWYTQNYGFYVANHEYGHGARLTAMGFTYNYAWNGSGQVSSIFPFILQGYGHADDGAATIPVSGGGVSAPSDWLITVSAGGMNNSMMFAEHLEDEVAFNTGHINQIGAYYRAKRDAKNYATATDQGFSGDLSALIGYWNAKGYSISTANVATGSMVALFGSFTTWAYVWSVGRFIAGGDPNVEAFRVGSFKLPDLSFFQNRNGLSYRLRSAIDLGSNASLPVSVEYVYRGSATVEASVGLRQSEGVAGIRKAGSLVQGYLSSAGGFGIRAAKDFDTGGSLFTVGGGLFSVDSLEGERTVSRLLSASFGLEFWGRWSLRL